MKFVTGKVWQLHEGADEQDVVVLVEEQIAPRYTELHPDVILGLVRLDGGRFLTTQTWPDIETFQQVTSTDAYLQWFDRYRPVLSLWDNCVSFVEEWAGEVVR